MPKERSWTAVRPNRGGVEDNAAVVRATSPDARRRLLLIGAGVAGVVACIALLLAIADEVREQEAIWLDTAATPLLHGLASPGLDTLMQGLTQLGSTAPDIAGQLAQTFQ